MPRSGRAHERARDVRAIALIDGEHYPDVVRDALAGLPFDTVAAVLVGGGEKLRGGEDYGVPLAATLEEAVLEHRPEIVFDLSDEPVLGPVERFRLASRSLALGVPYVGPDFRLDPPRFEPVSVPSLAIVGTGKRVGKTAVTGHVARTLARGRRVVVLAMGRGGPAEPETIELPPTIDTLLALARAGRHAASDHLETAALAGVPTVGCRRCGGGLAGAVAASNVHEGIVAAEALDPELLVFDGSGAALPPVAAGRRVLVVGAHQDRAVATGYLNAYRALLADMIVVTMAEDDVEHALLAAALGALARPGVPIIRATLRPRPVTGVDGRRVAFFGTAPATQHARIAAHLTDEYGADVTHVLGGSRGPRASARRAATRRGRRVRRRAEGRGRRRRGRGGALPRCRDRACCERRRATGWGARPRPRIGAAGGRGRGRDVGAGVMRQRRYLAPLPLGGADGPPWSKGLMARALAATGLTPTRAYELALHADGDMARRGALALDLDRLAEIAPDVLGEAEAGRTMRRLRRLQALQQLDLPVVLLVGGATGTGKSTLATEAAHRLGITRVTSTDFIRQTMRAFFAKEFMPSVHYSSFEAQLALVKADEDVSEDAALLGFLDQTRNVLVGVEAAIDRALEEGWSMVLEGVHLVPGMVSPNRADALVVQCIVAITDEDVHRSHFLVRDVASDGVRPLEKYLDGLPEIRLIQDVLLSGRGASTCR